MPPFVTGSAPTIFIIPAMASHGRVNGILVTSVGDLPTVHTIAFHTRAWEWRERGLRATFPCPKQRPRAAIVDRAALGFDIDTPADLAELHDIGPARLKS